MSLGNILKEIEQSRPNAEMDVDMGSPATLGGRKGLKRAAIENINFQKLQYRKELLTTTLFIVVTGSDKDSFSSVATNDTFKCFSSDPEALYKGIASQVSPTLFGRENAKNLFNIASNVLENKALDLDIQSYPMLQFNEKYNKSVNSADDLATLLKEAMNDQIGSEMVGINAVYSLVDEAIKRGHSSNVTPVILNTNDEKFALDLNKNLKRLTKNVFLVSAGKSSKLLKATPEMVVVKSVSEESVGEALSTIRNKVVQ